MLQLEWTTYSVTMVWGRVLWAGDQKVVVEREQ